MVPDEKKADKIDKALDRVQDIIELKAHLNNAEDQRFTIMQLEQNKAYVKNVILREDKNIDTEIKDVLAEIKKVDETGKDTLTTTETLYNERFGNIPAITMHLFDYAKVCYVDKIIKNYNEISEEFNKEQVAQDLGKE